MKTTELTKNDLNKSKKQVIEKINSKEDQFISEMEEIENNDFDDSLGSSNVLAELEELRKENEVLKAEKQRPLFFDFEEAAEIIKKKNQLIDEISKLQAAKVILSNINLRERTDNNSLDSYYYSLGLIYGSRDEFIFKVSNITTIEEFINFALIRLDIKTEALKIEVQNL